MYNPGFQEIGNVALKPRSQQKVETCANQLLKKSCSAQVSVEHKAESIPRVASSSQQTEQLVLETLEVVKRGGSSATPRPSKQARAGASAHSAHAQNSLRCRKMRGQSLRRFKNAGKLTPPTQKMRE